MPTGGVSIVWVALYSLAVIGFLLLMAWAEEHGPVARTGSAPSSCSFPVMVYAAIGIWGRTSDADEYYVAGRRIPPVYNGMAAAADWMSAASFISLSAALVPAGLWWHRRPAGRPGLSAGLDGGFCLVAMLVAPHLRAMQLYTLPDFFQARFGGRWPRTVAARRRCCARSPMWWRRFTGWGLIASRLTGVQFEIGIMLGLGGVLLCSSRAACAP